MIRVDRKNVPMPEILRRGAGGPAGREFEQASAFYANIESTRQRGGFQFKLYKHRDVRRALEHLFHGKCAYCESPVLASGPGDVEFFRPKAGVIAADGTHLPLHYWWLAAEWSNLYLACIDCNRIGRRQNGEESTHSGKGGRFPLEDEGLRAPPLATGAVLAEERPLLLDPCADDVEAILVFTEDGLVQSTEQRGLVTIEILGLNRVALVEARRQTARRLKTLLQMVFLAQDSAGEHRDAQGHRNG